MKVWSIEGEGHFGGGLAVVAANTVERARELAGQIRDAMWRTDYAKGEVTLLDNVDAGGEERVITHFETGE